MRVSIVMILFGLCAAGYPARGQPTSEQPNPPAPAAAPSTPGTTDAQPVETEAPAFSRLEVRTNPLLDLHLFTRAVAAGSVPAPAIEGFDAAVGLIKTISESAGDRAWALIDGGLAGCSTIADARAWSANVDLSANRPNARMAHPTMGADQLIEAYAAIEPAFLQQIWPEHEKIIRQATDRLRGGLLAKEHDCLADAMTSLGISDPRVNVPMYLVAHAPPPGGITYRTRAGAVCIVDVSAHAGAALDEAVLHESLHALDVGATGQNTVLTDLRTRMRGDGSRPSPGWRDVPHTVIFAQAAATIRKLVDPSHQDYGITGGYYDRVKPAADAVRLVWADYAAGKISRSDAIDRMIKGYVPPAPAP